MVVSDHNTNKINHTVCFALCQLALPHDVTGGDVSDVIRRQKTRDRQKRPSGKGQGRLGRGQLFLTRAAATQQRRAVVSKQHTTTTRYSWHNSQVTGQNSTGKGNEEHEKRAEGC